MSQIFLLALGFMLAAVNAQAQRYAIVDTKYILDKMPEYKDAQKRLDQTSQQWQLTGYEFGDYPDSYEIMDYTGQCITTTNGWTVKLLACDGSSAQKWNAPQVATTSQVGGVAEQ